MPGAGGSSGASTGPSVYKIWKDSVPVLPFPFQYNTKSDGKITQTWTDVKDGLNRDALNTALAFSTGHFTPTAKQSEVMRELMLKEEQRLAKTIRQQSASTQKTGGGGYRPMTAGSRMSGVSAGPSSTTGGLATTPEVATATTMNSTGGASRSRVRGEIMSAKEKDALYSSEGGGRGRVAYLKMRRSRSVQQRYGERPQTSAHMYGWDCTEESLKRLRSHSSTDAAVEGGKPSKKNGGLGSWNRTSGIFAKPEFIQPY